MLGAILMCFFSFSCSKTCTPVPPEMREEMRRRAIAGYARIPLISIQATNQQEYNKLKGTWISIDKIDEVHVSVTGRKMSWPSGESRGYEVFVDEMNMLARRLK